MCLAPVDPRRSIPGPYTRLQEQGFRNVPIGPVAETQIGVFVTLYVACERFTS